MQCVRSLFDAPDSMDFIFYYRLAFRFESSSFLVHFLMGNEFYSTYHTHTLGHIVATRFFCVRFFHHRHFSHVLFGLKKLLCVLYDFHERDVVIKPPLMLSWWLVLILLYYFIYRYFDYIITLNVCIQCACT